MPKQPVDLADKLGLFSELWTPKIVAGYNGNDIIVVKVEGTPNTGDAETAAEKVRI